MPLTAATGRLVSYEAKGAGPTVRVLGRTSGVSVSVRGLYQLFPHGPAKEGLA